MRKREYLLKIKFDLLKTDLETIYNYVAKKESERRAYYVKKAFELVDRIPTIEGNIVERTGNDYFGRSREYGVIIEVENKSYVKFNYCANVINQIFSTTWREKTNKTLKQQIAEKLEAKEIDINDIIIFNFYDYEDKTYNYNYTIKIKMIDLIPYIAKRIKEETKNF